MSELWEQAVALGEARHQVVMALLAGTLADPKSIRELEVFLAVDEVNRFVDGIDRTNSTAISKALDILTRKLTQLHSEARTDPVSRSGTAARQPSDP